MKIIVIEGINILDTFGTLVHVVHCSVLYCSVIEYFNMLHILQYMFYLKEYIHTIFIKTPQHPLQNLNLKNNVKDAHHTYCHITVTSYILSHHCHIIHTVTSYLLPHHCHNIPTATSYILIIIIHIYICALFEIAPV